MVIQSLFWTWILFLNDLIISFFTTDAKFVVLQLKVTWLNACILLNKWIDKRNAYMTSICKAQKKTYMTSIFNPVKHTMIPELKYEQFLFCFTHDISLLRLNQTWSVTHTHRYKFRRDIVTSSHSYFENRRYTHHCQNFKLILKKNYTI